MADGGQSKDMYSVFATYTKHQILLSLLERLYSNYLYRLSVKYVEQEENMEALLVEDVTLSHSQEKETLRRVKENDKTLKNLWIGGTVSKSRQNNQPTIMVQHTRKMLKSREGIFSPSDDSEFSSLSAYIAKNTNLTTLLNIDGRMGLDFECLWRNSSIYPFIN